MVNMHCKMAVKEELKKLGLHFIFVNMSVVDIMENITIDQREQIRMALSKSGLELIDDKKAVLIEKIKNLILEMIRQTDGLSKTNFSDYLSEQLDYDYSCLASLFSEGYGTSIEEFIIFHKIERVKELIIYNELSLSEIAWKMDFNSVSHLSSQFKKITGLAPSHFKKLNEKRRVLIEDI
jgi:AraC-like DNA-binding protein